MVLLQSHAGVGFQIGMRFQATAFSNLPRLHPVPPSRPLTLRVEGWSSSSSSSPSPRPTRRSRPRYQPSCRSYSTLFSSADDGNSSSGAEGDSSGVPERRRNPSPSGDGRDDAAAAAANGNVDGAEVKPEPRADEQVSGGLVDAAAPGAGGSVTAEGGVAGVSGEEEIDWDKAWASTRKRMEREKREAPAFSGRKQIIATKNDDGSYDYEEISADGSRKTSGAKGRGAFGFADSNQVEEDGPGRIRRNEQEAVNFATTNQAFAGLFAILLASFIFEVYVYMSGGITNGSTRFENIGQPTTYDALPLPATPPPVDDLTV